MIVWVYVALVAGAMVLAALATPVTRQLACKLGMIDLPRAHKAHAQATPLLGGSAVFAGILLPSLLGLALASAWAGRPPAWLPRELAICLPGMAAKAPQAMGILAGAMILHVLGLIDDRHNLGPWSKLAVQVLVSAGTVLLLNVRVLTVAGPTLSAAASIVWIVVITNAFNFLDNMDGLCAGVAAIVAAALLGASASIGQLFVSAWLCLILGATLGYLPYNFAPASTFMGDAGSLVLGYLLAVVSSLTTYAPVGEVSYAYGVLVPLVVMAVPLYDTASVLWLRVRDRRNPMVGDRRHFSHRLLRRGMSVPAAALTIYLCTAGTALSASLLPHVANVTGAALVGAQTVVILGIIALLEWGDRRP
jgi:UDP-GlcNAc:undecaprenyl-phosphate GlcNAc-1-phosphate transferase